MFGIFFPSISERLEEVELRLHACVRSLDALHEKLDDTNASIARLLRVVREESRATRGDQMATAETLAKLQDEVRRNTSAVASAKAALAGYVATVKELTDKLEKAIDNGDETDVIAVVEALAANNAALEAAIPTVAEAVVANTTSP